MSPVGDGELGGAYAYERVIRLIMAHLRPRLVTTLSRPLKDEAGLVVGYFVLKPAGPTGLVLSEALSTSSSSMVAV